jgi:predicted RNase H-like HicB family nuclease
MNPEIDFDLEEDGRWIAEARGLPGVLAYGSTQADARSKVEVLAAQVILERSLRTREEEIPDGSQRSPGVAGTSRARIE